MVLGKSDALEYALLGIIRRKVNIVNALVREFGLTSSSCNRITVEKPDERSLNSLAVVMGFYA